MILDDIVARLNEKANELEVEGLNSAEYWVKRIGIDDDEFMAFISDRCERIIQASQEWEVAIQAVYIEAFVVGYLARRGKGG